MPRLFDRPPRRDPLVWWCWALGLPAMALVVDAGRPFSEFGPFAPAFVWAVSWAYLLLLLAAPLVLARLAWRRLRRRGGRGGGPPLSGSGGW